MAISMQRLQRADRLLGSLAGVALQPLRLLRALRHPRPVERVLCIKFWGLGSLQLLTPAVAVLRRRHPAARITLLTLGRNREFAQGLRAFDEVLDVEVDAESWTGVLGALVRCMRLIRGRRFDRVYDFEFFARFSAVVALLSGAPTSIGFWAPGFTRDGFHNRLVPFHRGWHVARNFRALAGGEDGTSLGPESLAPFRVGLEHRLEAATLLFESGAAGAGPLVVLNPNAGELSLERRWPAERFAELARRLIDEDGARVALIGSRGERERARLLKDLVGREASGRLFDLSGQLSIGGLVALLRECEVFVTNDSGPMHVAAAQGVATIGLFGPETPALYQPLGARARFLYMPSPCSPCINVHENKLARCMRGHAECMTNLSVGYVLAAVRDELGRERRLVPAEEIVQTP